MKKILLLFSVIFLIGAVSGATVEYGEKNNYTEDDAVMVAEDTTFSIASIGETVWLNSAGDTAVGENRMTDISLGGSEYFVTNCGIYGDKTSLVVNEEEPGSVSSACGRDDNEGSFKVPIMEKVTYEKGETIPYGDYSPKEIEDNRVTFSTSSQIRDVTKNEYKWRSISHSPPIVMYICQTRAGESVDLVFRNIDNGGDRELGNPEYVCNLEQEDSDNDGRPNDRDPCPYVAEGDHTDYDGDGIGYACDGYVLSCQAPHAEPDLNSIEVSGNMQPGEEVTMNARASAAYVSTSITNYEWYVDEVPYKSGRNKGSITKTFEDEGEHSVTVKVTGECGEREMHKSKTREFTLESQDFKKSGGFDHWDNDLSTSSNLPDSMTIRPNYKENRLSLDADVWHRAEGVRFKHSFTNGQMNIYRFGYKLKNGGVNWLEDGDFPSQPFNKNSWNYLRFPETEKPIDSWLFGVYNGHDDERGRLKVKELQPAVTEKIERPEKVLEVKPRGDNFPRSYAIRQPRVRGNQRASYALGDWGMATGVVLKNTGYEEISLNPVIKMNGDSINNDDFASTYSTREDFSDGLSIPPGKEKTVALNMDAGDVVESRGEGKKKFTLEVNGREIDLGSITVTDEPYMVLSHSASGEIEKGKEVSVKFSGNGKASIAGGEIPEPVVVVGSRDRERIFGKFDVKTSSGSSFDTSRSELAIPGNLESDVVAVAVEKQGHESHFRSGKGFEKEILDVKDDGGNQPVESGCQEDIEALEQKDFERACTQQIQKMQCPDGEKTYRAKNGCEIDFLRERNWEGGFGGNKEPGKISIETPENVETGEDTSVSVKVPDSKQEEYQVIIKAPGGETLYDDVYSEETRTFVFTPEEPGSYRAKIFPTGSIQSIINLVTGPIKEADFEVEPKDQADWRKYCSEKGYNPGEENIDEAIACLRDEVVENCFSTDPGEKCMEDGVNTVAESTCQDLLNYDYSPETQKCTP